MRLAATDCVSQYCEHIKNEIFECDGTEEIVKLANEFFELMPNL